MLSMYSHNSVLCPQKYILCGDKSSKSQNIQEHFAAESKKTQLWIFFKQVLLLVLGNQKLWDEIKDSKML